MKPKESVSRWKNWGDHPVVVLFGVIAALITIIAFLISITNQVTPEGEPSILGIGSTMNGFDGMTLLYVPAGEFEMGTDNGYSNETPVHQVYLDAFWIDKTEVTNKMYKLCVSVGFCNAPIDTASYTRTSYYGDSKYDNYPVLHVNWNMAKNYCEWAGR